MKSYTNIDQSRKLAEFLPPESADMCWDYDVIKHEDYPMVMDEQFDDCCIPAWSLVALLNILPSSTLDSSDDHHFRLHCNEKFTDWYDNPIDACVEMIDRIHEQIIHDFNNS